MSLRLFTLILLFSCGFAFAQTPQTEDVATVRYDYTKWSRVGAARYVLLPVSTTIKPGTLEERTRALFTELVQKKPSTYGDARLAFQPDASQTGVVYVYLDATKSQYHRIVMAETVFTFTENGATKVIFPKVAPQGWTRENVPYAAYVLDLALTDSLPPNVVAQSLVHLKDNSRVTAESAAEKLPNSPELQAELYEALKTAPRSTAIAIMNSVTEMDLANRKEHLLPFLQSADTELRKAALEASRSLTGADRDKAVRAVMEEDPEPEVRALAAQVLGASQDVKVAAQAQYHALRGNDESKAVAAATVLATVPGAESEKELTAALSHKFEAVRSEARKSLVARNAHKAIFEALPGLSLDLRLEHARALTSLDHLDSQLEGHLHLLANGSDDEALAAVDILEKHANQKTLAAMAKGLEHKSNAVAAKCATGLANTGNTEAFALLAKANGKTTANLETALHALYLKQEIVFVQKSMRHSDALLKRTAIAALGERTLLEKGKWARKEAIEYLRPLEQSKDPEIRAAVALSLADLADRDVEADVAVLAQDSNVVVQRAAAIALGKFPGKSSEETLLRYAKSEDSALIANSLRSLGKLQVKDARDVITPKLVSKDTEVRCAATEALVGVGAALSEDERGPLLSFFSDRMFDEDARIRRASIDGLMLVNDTRVLTALSALLQDQDVNVKKAAILAMGQSGDASAVEGIATALEDEDPMMRQAALDAFEELNHKDAVPVLRQYAQKEQDAILKTNAESLIKKLTR